MRVAAAVLEDLYAQLKKGAGRRPRRGGCGLRMAMDGPDPASVRDEGAVRTERKLVMPRSPNQAAYMRALDRHDLVFAIGPGGHRQDLSRRGHGVALL